MTQSTKRWTGGLALVAMTFAVVYLAVQLSRPASRQADEPNAAQRETIRTVARYLTTGPIAVTQVDPRDRLIVGDPVFLAQASGNDTSSGNDTLNGIETLFKQVGAVKAIRASESGDGRDVTIAWYAADIKAEECQLIQYESSGRLSEVVATLLPPDKRKRIEKRIAMVVAEHGEQLSRAFVPLVQKTLRESMPIVEAEFRRSVANHRPEIDAATRRWKDELIDKRLIPLAKREILPIVQKHGQPPAEKIGREIWDKASLFRFGWRAMYDKSPLPQRDLLQDEWKRFVDQEAVPVMEKHMDEIVVAIQRSLRELSTNKQFRDELGKMAGEIASDPESQQLITVVLRETLVENERLREVWKDVWSSPEAQQAFRIASDRLEPVVRQIGDEIFGSEEAGIDPNFARVLRSQILRKDRRWIVAWQAGASDGVIQMGRKPMPYPIVYVAQEGPGQE